MSLKMMAIKGLTRPMLVLFAMLMCSSSSVNAELPHAVVAEKPAKGPAVKVAQGFMIPYNAKIPGTDVTYKMIPIPGGIVQLVKRVARLQKARRLKSRSNRFGCRNTN
jgi:hypothetical protein